MKLTYRDRRTTGTQLDVLSGSIEVCFLHKAMQSPAFKGERWDWHWHMSKGPPNFYIHDSAGTKAEAQAKIESVWQAWLDAAGLSDTKV